MNIQNPFLSISASPMGGELTSIQLFRQEILYQKDGWWQCQDHLIFPIIGKGDRYSCHHVALSMNQHGFPRTSDMLDVKNRDTSMSFSMRSTPDTLRSYPYPFRLTETFELDDDVLIRTHEVENTGEETMPFGIGDHAAYQVRFGKAKLILPPLRYIPKSRDGITHSFDETFPFSGELFLDAEKEFMLNQDTIIFINEGLPIILHTGKGVAIEFHSSSPYVAMWTPPNSDGFLCLEPWWGLPTRDKDPLELAERKELHFLEPGQKASFQSRIRFFLD